MADCEPWIDTEPSTWVKNNNAANSHSFNETHNQLKAGLPGGASKQTSSDNADPVDDLVDYGLFAKLVPQNRSARDALSRLTHSPDNTYQHHRQFINIDPRTDGNLSERTDCFVFSLGLLPQFPSLGWRIGKGRPKISNLAVDILLPDGDGVAGVHGRFCWIKGSGGFFIIADNLRGQPVIMNGERLQHTQRLIPYRNAIAFGECYFSVQFETRSPAQDEQFQVELAAFYTRVLQDSAPLVLPTPSEHEIRIGNWIVRNPIASGAFGRVSFVTHAHTGLPAAMKELWQTPRNSLNVKREVIMAKMLKNLKHKRLGTPFEIYHKRIHDKYEMSRIAALLDETWRPGPSDTIDYHILYSPLSTGNFYAVIRSKASREVRTRLFTQVLEGLAFLHKNGVAHRDIKPGNLMVKSYDPPDAQIIDFGCATFETRILYDRPGTVPYLAPEQVEGEYHGQAVDYWSVALVGVELMEFKRPEVKVTADILAGIHTWLDRQPVDPLGECCKGMLQISPDHRMTAAEALQGCLSSFQDRLIEDGKRSAEILDKTGKRRGSFDLRMAS